MTRALQLPLELAASESNVDSHYLEKRDRTKWWGREPFPKVGDAGRWVQGPGGRRGAAWAVGQAGAVVLWAAACEPASTGASGWRWRQVGGWGGGGGNAVALWQ